MPSFWKAECNEPVLVQLQISNTSVLQTGLFSPQQHVKMIYFKFVIHKSNDAYRDLSYPSEIKDVFQHLIRSPYFSKTYLSLLRSPFENTGKHKSSLSDVILNNKSEVFFSFQLSYFNLLSLHNSGEHHSTEGNIRFHACLWQWMHLILCLKQIYLFTELYDLSFQIFIRFGCWAAWCSFFCWRWARRCWSWFRSWTGFSSTWKVQ